MANYQVYCTVADVVAGLKDPGGNVGVILGHIQAASDYLFKQIGPFIPTLESLRMDGSGKLMQKVPPLLSIISLSVDGIPAIQDLDYFAYPLRRHWADGPYSWLEVNTYGGSMSLGWYEKPNCIALTAYTGYYLKTAATGAALAAEQKASDSTLTVNDGSKLSPGMHVALDTEMELVTDYGAPSAAVTTLGTTITSSDNLLTLASGATVKKGELIRIGFEQMQVQDDPQTNSVSVRRGWNGTQAVAHTAGASVDVYRTFQVERGINGSTAALHANLAAISRYLVPGNIFFLAKEIACLMKRKEDSSYAGKTGNAALGETFYNDIYPRFDIDPVRKMYKIRVLR